MLESARVIRRTLLPLLALLIGLVPAPAASQVPIQFDTTSVFNADVIVNTDPAAPSGFDPTQSPIDVDTGANNNFAFPTQSAANAACLSPAGLPDGFRGKRGLVHGRGRPGRRHLPRPGRPPGRQLEDGRDP